MAYLFLLGYDNPNIAFKAMGSTVSNSIHSSQETEKLLNDALLALQQTEKAMKSQGYPGRLAAKSMPIGLLPKYLTTNTLTLLKKIQYKT